MLTVQLIGREDCDIDLMAIVLNDDNTCDQSTVCFYGNRKVIRKSSPSDNLSDQPVVLANLLCLDDNPIERDKNTSFEILEEIKISLNVSSKISISCYENHPDKRKRVFKNWDGFVRLILDGAPAGDFDTTDIGDLSKTGCIELCTLAPNPDNPYNPLIIYPNIKKYKNTRAWFNEFGIKTNFSFVERSKALISRFLRKHI